MSTIATTAAWIDEQLAATWESTWQQHLPAITAMHERMGEPAYALYNRELFTPVQRRLADTGVTCRPVLPGTLPLSEEEWGPQDHRERRMWTLLRDADDQPVGAVVTRFFHDHTQLRLPDRPSVVGLAETDHDRIRAIILQDRSTWPATS